MSRKRLGLPADGAAEAFARDQHEGMLRDDARAYLGVPPEKVPSDLAPHVERLNSAAKAVSEQLCREDHRKMELPVRGEPDRYVVLADSTILSGLEALKWSHPIITFAVLFDGAAGCFELQIQYNIETGRTRSVEAVPITREEGARWFLNCRELAPEHLRPRAWGEPSAAEGPAAKPPDAASHTPKPEEAPPETTGIDFAGIATELHKQGKHTPARLVKYMAAKEQATGEEIGEFVHDDEEASRSTIWNNAQRTSDSLLTLCPRLSFQYRGSIMYRTIKPD
jgi:hypothetical protein